MMGLSRTVSEIDGDFSRKIAKFSHPLYFVPRSSVSINVTFEGIDYKSCALPGNHPRGITATFVPITAVFPRLPQYFCYSRYRAAL